MIRATRVPEWESRVHALIERYRDAPFDLCTHNCCHWAAACAHAVLGVDVWAHLQGPVQLTPRAVAVWLRQHGGVRGTAGMAFGEERAALQLRRGDIALVHGVYDEAIGTADAPHSLALMMGELAWAVGTNGLVNVSLEKVIAGWRVGDVQNS